MPWFDVICSKCGYKEKDYEKPYSLDFPIKCHSCNKKTLIKDYSSPDALPDFHIKEIKSLAQQSEFNEKKLGKEQISKKRDTMMTDFDKKKEKAEKPWYWSENQTKPLDVSKISNISEYIEHGIK